ncbi:MULTISPECIES: helix-turn-helix transcriptional regulator [unclassified Microbacterium]|uniref:helix-turn-helix transcriptional regulator n=1 Tax=unclassified Microbacterium TaxID=2609290 RepID=UPI001443BF64|nr:MULTISPECIES: LuxR C-terminal-related transcriptional regulator [unclassified Microbacterium]
MVALLQRSGLVDRPRLRRIFDAFEREIRVVGIWAPAGSGKSVLLRQWMATVDGLVCFADAADEAQVFDAIQRSRAAGASRVYLVIDQLDRSSAQAREAIAAAVDSGGVRLRVVLAGRFDALPVSPARWARTSEISGADLAFTADEATSLLADVTAPTGKQLRGLLARTGGWATALVLVRRLRETGDGSVVDRFDGDSRPVADYLVTEVLSALDPEQEEVLVWSAVAPTVSAALAVTVTGSPDAGRVLEQLACANSLVMRQDADSYRFHPILWAFLAAEQRRRDLPRANSAHAAAARWFSARGDLRSALAQTVRAADAAALAAFLDQHGYELIFQGESGPVMRAVRAVAPRDRERLEADMGLLLAIPHFPDRPGAAQLLRVRTHAQRRAERTAVDEIVDALWAHANRRRGDMRDRPPLAVDASCSRGTALLLEYVQVWTTGGVDGEMNDNMSAALVHLGSPTADTSELRWLRMLILESALSIVSRAPSRVDMEPVLLQIERDWLSGADERDTVAARAVCLQATRAYHRADPLSTSVLEHWSPRAGARLDHLTQMLLALDELTRRGGGAALARVVALIENDLSDTVSSLAYAVVPAIGSAIRQGDVPLADRLLARCRRVLGEYSVESATAAFLRHPNREGDHVLREALAGGAPRFTPLALASAWVALAVHAHRHRRDASATAAILNALMCAAPLGAVRPFLQEGNEPSVVLRARIQRLGAWRPVAEEILAHPDMAMPEKAATVTIAKLTAREQELLRELPAHQSIAEIAGRRYVSANTVKSQLRSIYSKLQVNGRAEAVEAARRVGLL